MKRLKSSMWRASLSVAMGIAVLAIPPAPVLAAVGDTAFLAARDAAGKGDAARLARALTILPASHPLRPWAEYWQLQQQLAADDDRGIGAFLAANEGSYLAEKLRGDWLRWLGKQERWETFQREWPHLLEPDNELRCYAAQAAATPQMVRPLWLAGEDLPASCNALVDRLVAAGGLTVEDVWQRVRRLLEAKKVGAGKAAAQYLPADQGFDDKELEAIAADPARYLNQLPADAAHAAASRGRRETILFALQRLAHSDPPAAAQRLSALEAAFSTGERAYAWGQIAWQAARRHQPEALAWFDRAQGVALSEEQLAWQARAALRAGDWAAVRRAIAAMPPFQAAQPAWVYWQGRALLSQGTVTARHEALAMFRKIADRADFYGNLAGEELGQPLTLPMLAAPLLAEERAAADAHPGLRRALALLALNMRTEGVREWNWSLRGMNDRQLLASADLARRNQVWDRAIASAERTRFEHDFGLRYLAPFLDAVLAETQAQSLDPAWVYGLMRQESRFVTQASSAVGARGLMQVMPATARWVAKKIRLANFHPQQMNELETNVRLGTSYLRMVLDALDSHPVLATAAYNAGPGRARRWRGAEPMEGAIYAETIPFAETRDYVKKVMSNTQYYAVLLGSRPLPLKTRLGTILPAGSRDAVVAELP